MSQLTSVMPATSCCARNYTTDYHSRSTTIIDKILQINEVKIHATTSSSANLSKTKEQKTSLKYNVPKTAPTKSQ